MKTAFIISVVLMLLHKIESFYTNEYHACPVYARLAREAKTVQEALFKTFCTCLFAALAMILAIWQWGDRAITVLLVIWAFTFVHEIHHPVQTFISGSYYSGTITAWAYVLFGSVYYWCLASRLGVSPALGPIAHACLINAYFHRLRRCSPVVMRCPSEHHGVYINKSTKRLDGKKILVTGSNRGIGLCLVKHLSDRGARVVAACRSKQRADELKQRVPCVSTAVVDMLSPSFDVDVSDVDVVVLNAGIDGSNEQLCTDVNYAGTKRLLDYVRARMPSKGKIVILSSIAIHMRNIPFKNLSCYGKSKYDLLKYALSIPCTNGVTINAFHPGIVDTGQFKLGSFVKGLLHTSKVFNSPSEFAHVLSDFICDERSIHGKYFNLRVQEKF